jgi:hypothetical protein
MWRRVVWYIVTYISEKPAASIFRVEEKSTKETGLDLYSEVLVSVLGRNTG